jgi:pectate lyase C
LGSGGDASGGASSGGGGADATGGSGGDNSGGTSSGGSSSGGSSSGGSSSGGSGGGTSPAIGPGPCGCTTSAGEFGTVNSTIVVDEGEVYDGGCKTFRANPDTLGDGSQGENQLPVFRVNDGGTLRNVILGASAADGVHTYGDVTLQNIHWLDIGEDAMTVKESGTVNLDCGSATNGDDKVFQVNAASTVRISNFTASNAGKFMRQNGGTTFKVDVFIDHSDISGMDECIFRTDSSSSHVTFTNSYYSDIGDSLFIFGDEEVNGNSDQSSVSNIEEE